MNVSSVFRVFDSRDGAALRDRGRNESIKHRRDSKRQPIVYITRHTRAQHGQKNNFRIMPPPPLRRKNPKPSPLRNSQTAWHQAHSIASLSPPHPRLKNRPRPLWALVMWIYDGISSRPAPDARGCP